MTQTSPYCIHLSRNFFEDGVKIRGVGSLANALANHKYTTTNSRGLAVLTKNIKNREEILVSYGNTDYIKMELNSSLVKSNKC